MEGLISNLLDLTRARLGGGMPIVRADVDLENECRDAVDEIAAFHPDCTVRFEATGGLRGQWDGARIVQALSNLLGNAVQHGTKGHPILVSLRGDPENVTLSVHNQGRPIPEHHLREIFDPFRQLTPSQADSSVGLGLYIVQAIAVAHAGTVEVESSDEGTTFTMHLPRAAPA